MDSKVNIRFNVPPMSSPQNKKGKLEVKIEGSSPDAIAKHYELTGGGNNDTNLLSAINKVVLLLKATLLLLIIQCIELRMI